MHYKLSWGGVNGHCYSFSLDTILTILWLKVKKRVMLSSNCQMSTLNSNSKGSIAINPSLLTIHLINRISTRSQTDPNNSSKATLVNIRKNPLPQHFHPTCVTVANARLISLEGPCGGLKDSSHCVRCMHFSEPSTSTVNFGL